MGEGVIYRETGLKVSVTTVRETFNRVCFNFNEKEGGTKGNVNNNMR